MMPKTKRNDQKKHMSQDGRTVAKISLYTLFANSLRKIAYRYLTVDSLPLFTRGRDISALSVNVLGYHEIHTRKILEWFAKDGNSDFLIDIGANIGLTSCQSGDHFRQIIMFEPNPLCIGILQTNAAVSLAKGSYEINPFALGKQSEFLKLRIPKHNWGGAYIVSGENSYSAETLYRKDGFTVDDDTNYLSYEVEVKCAEDVFVDLFHDLCQKGRYNGSIKIDVEGMELEILHSIANTLPTDMNISIIFENLGDKFPGHDILSEFSGRAKLYALRRHPSKTDRSITGYFKLLFNPHLSFILEEWHDGLNGFDLVLKVSNK